MNSYIRAVKIRPKWKRQMLKKIPLWSQKPIVEITDLKIADHFDLGEKPFFSFLPGVKKTIFEGVKKKIVTMVRWWTW